MNRTDQLMKQYSLLPHPEGGYFSEYYTAPFSCSSRALCGSIFFLLKNDDISHFHQIDCDEIWYYHEGCGMKIHVIDQDGYHCEELSPEGSFCIVLPKGVLFAAENLDRGSYTFVSCATTPAFAYAGFRLVPYREISHINADLSYLCISQEK